jgi:hypothetical protein
MRVSAYGSIRVPRVGSTGLALLEHRWYIGGMKLASFPLELVKPLACIAHKSLDICAPEAFGLARNARVAAIPRVIFAG